MKKFSGGFRLAPAILLTLAALACSPLGGAALPKLTLAPIALGGGLTTLDVCQAVPQAAVEAVMGRKLVAPPTRYADPDFMGNGCKYDAGKDSSGTAYFGYVELTPASAYKSQPLSESVAVSGVGQAAYFTNGADARQLWVKVNDQVAFEVAFGDQPNEAGATALAKAMVAAMQ
jgi:hypothetical protein